MSTLLRTLTINFFSLKDMSNFNIMAKKCKEKDIYETNDFYSHFAK